jgi:glutathione S-transferase
MAEPLKLYDLSASPNSVKIRIALAYKGIPHEKIPVDPRDRSEIIRLSGQPLTPILTHGSVVIFDSGAILRYLDAAFRETPSLFSRDYDTMHEIEAWELLSRTTLSDPVEIIFEECFAEKKDPSAAERASRMLHEATARFEERLLKGEWLVGDRMTAADVATAPSVYYGMLPPEVASATSIARFFAEHLRLGNGRDRTRAWAARVMSYDR